MPPILNYQAQKQVQGGSPEPAPELLVLQGPVVHVTLSLSDAIQRALRELNHPVPSPVVGVALIDTGATTTCFDQAFATRAGLPITGPGVISSASHANHIVPVFSGKLVLDGLNVTIDIKQGLGVNLSGMSSPELQASGMPPLIALIGRDVLQNAMLVYNGAEGHFSLAM